MAIGAPPSAMPKPTTPKAVEGGASDPDAKKEPFGQSSATQATPNTGYEAVVLQRVGVLTKQIQDMMQMVGAGSEIGKDLLKMLNIAVKMSPAGNVTPTAEKNMLEQAQMRNTQNMNQTRMLKTQMGSQPGAPGVAATPAVGAA